MEKLTSDYGVIIKWSDYFIECYDYCLELLSFIDDVIYYLDASKKESQIYQMYRVKTNGGSTKNIEY